MAWLYERNGIWWLGHRKDGKVVRDSLGPIRKSEAQRIKVRVEFNLLENPQHVPDILLSDAFDGFILAQRHRSAETLHWYARRLKRWMRSVHDDILIGEIRSADIQTYRDSRLDDGRAPATVRGDIGAIRVFLNWCVDKGWLPSIPMTKGCRRVHGVQARAKIALAADERSAYAEKLAGFPMYPVYLFGVHAGLRCGELCHLEYSDIRDGLIHVRPKDGWHPKDYQCRTIPAAPEIATILPELPRTGVLFPEPRGHVRDIYNLARDWRQTMNSLELPPHRATRAGRPMHGAQLHELRVTYASVQIQEKGVDIFTLKNRMGHSSIETTNGYLRLFRP